MPADIPRLEDLPRLAGRRVLLRADFNVPVRDGAITDDMTIQDWGVTYEDMEPHYDRFEYLCGTSGKAGNLRGQIQEGGNPFEGARSRDYPTPPMEMGLVQQRFMEGARKLGHKPYPQPSSNLSKDYTNPDGAQMQACTYCGHCERFGCYNWSKASPLTTHTPRSPRARPRERAASRPVGDAPREPTTATAGASGTSPRT